MKDFDEKDFCSFLSKSPRIHLNDENSEESTHA